MSFRQGVILPTPTQNEPLKSPPRLGLTSLKSDVDELDIEKINTFPIDLSKLSNVPNNDIN